MLDPADTLEYLFMGDSSGNIYRAEGTGTAGDNGDTSIETAFLTKLFSAPIGADLFDIEGWIKYRKTANAFTIELVFEFSGENLFNESVTIDVPASSGGSFYGGDVHYGGSYYYGSVSGRVSRKNFKIPGQGQEFQVRVKVTSAQSWSISEINLRFKAVTTP